MRLQRYLAQCGVASRRAAEELILTGRVKVNGRVVRELGTKIDPDKDRVLFHGRLVQQPTAPQVWMLNKPSGVITTMRDPQRRKTVASLLHVPGHRLVPVGRLDAGTTGLLLMTDDGDLALRLTHPRWGVEKDYLVTIEGTLDRDAKRALREGVALDGRPVAVEKIALARGVGPARQGCSRWRVVVHEGRRHLIRRLMDAVGHPVQGLHRERIGPIEIGQLASGKARRLTDEEHAALRAAVGLGSE